MKQIIVTLLTLITLSSCSVQQRAQRHLNRAIALDPTILSKLDTQVKIDTLVVRDTTVIVKARVDTIQSNIDSIITQYKEKGSATLLENDRLKVQLQNLKGHPTVIVQNKEIKIPIHDTVRITVTKTVPASIVHERQEVKGFFYYTGMVFIGSVAIFAIIIIILNRTGISNFFKRKT